MLKFPESDDRDMGDYWKGGDNRAIHLKEAHGLLCALQGASDVIKDSRVDAYVDNQPVVHAWKGQGSTDSQLTAILKDIFQLLVRFNVDLNVCYVPSALNIADAPSRSLSWQDVSLASRLWLHVESYFGPHTVDLMALHSNVMHSPDTGQPWWELWGPMCLPKI